MVISEMYDYQIVPCVPLIDVGYDLIGAYNNTLSRVQVKSTKTLAHPVTGAITFSTRRRKSCKNSREANSPHNCYAKKEIDLFIFVHIPTHQFFIVPGDDIDYSRHKISFRPEDPRKNAWHLFQI